MAQEGPGLLAAGRPTLSGGVERKQTSEVPFSGSCHVIALGAGLLLAIHRVPAAKSATRSAECGQGEEGELAWDLTQVPWRSGRGGLRGWAKERFESRRRGASLLLQPGASGPSAPPPDGLCSPVSFLFPSKLETRSVFLERGGQYANSDEEDGYESPDIKRRGTSVDDFLKGSELGKPVSARRGA